MRWVYKTFDVVSKKRYKQVLNKLKELEQEILNKESEILKLDTSVNRLRGRIHRTRMYVKQMPEVNTYNKHKKQILKILNPNKNGN